MLLHFPHDVYQLMLLIVGPNEGNKKCDLEGFYQELDEIMDMVKDQLLERFDIQCNKRVYNFPFLMGANVWLDSDKLKGSDKLKKNKS